MQVSEWSVSYSGCFTPRERALSTTGENTGLAPDAVRNVAEEHNSNAPTTI